jgi:hypothetical protein
MRLLLFKKVLYNCKKATLLSLKEEEGRLSLVERFQLSYHLMYCSVCRTFIRQSKEVQHHILEFKKHLADSPPYKLDGETKKSMEEKLKQLFKNHKKV